MLNSEFLEVSIFLYLPVSSRRNRQKSTPRKTIFSKLWRSPHDRVAIASLSCGERHAIAWHSPHKISYPPAPRAKKFYHSKTKRKTATTIGKKHFFCYICGWFLTKSS
ncbi:MAG: hypothetical protein ACOCNW_04420 [Prevotella sp.]